MVLARLHFFAGAHASLGFASLRGRSAALRAARNLRSRSGSGLRSASPRCAARWASLGFASLRETCGPTFVGLLARLEGSDRVVDAILRSGATRWHRSGAESPPRSA